MLNEKNVNHNKRKQAVFLKEKRESTTATKQTSKQDGKKKAVKPYNKNI